MSDHQVTLGESGYPLECSCAEYQRRKRTYRNALPCAHMQEVARAWEASRPAPPDPNRVRVDADPYYAASYDVVREGVRYVGDVSERGTVRLTSVEHAGLAADYPLDALTDDALRAAEAALVEQARAMAARGEVDMFSLPSVWTWREDAITATLHAAGPNDRRAQREIEDLRRDATERGIAIAARCAGRVAA